MPLRMEHSPMSPSPFILREISGVDPSVSVKGTLGRPPPAVSGDSSSPCGRTSRPGGRNSAPSHSLLLHFCLHCTQSRTKERENESTTLSPPPIARITMHTERGGRKSRPTPTPPPRVSSRCERGGTLDTFLPLHQIRSFSLARSLSRRRSMRGQQTSLQH